MEGCNNRQPLERCECHECTQARWRMSIQGQLSGAGLQRSQSQLTGEAIVAVSAYQTAALQRQ